MVKPKIEMDTKVFILLAFSLILNMTLVNYTQGQGQAEWWDSTEYLIMAKHIVNPEIPMTGFAAHREVVPGLFWVPFFASGLGEMGIHVFMAFMATFCVYLVYLLGKEMFSYDVGLISGFLMACFHDYLFYMTRLTMYIIAPTMFVALVLFFWRYMHGKGTYNLYLSMIITGLGMTVYYNTAFGLLIMGAFFLITNKKMLLNKHVWLAGILTLILLTPYFIYSMKTYGAPIPRIAAEQKAFATEAGGGLSAWSSYLQLMPFLLTTYPLIIFIIGLLLMYEIPLAVDLIIKEKEQKFNKDIYLLLWMIIPLILYTIVAIKQGDRGGVVLSAYLFILFPAIFMIIARTLIKVVELPFINANDNYKKFATFCIIAIVLFFGGIHVSTAFTSITSRLPAYKELKPVGEFVKTNTVPGQWVASASVPQLTYYSERPVTGIAGENETQWEIDTLRLNPKYYILTAYEPHPQWAYDYPQRKGLTIVKGFPEGQQPMVIVYQWPLVN